jgi:hypothetical protein
MLSFNIPCEVLEIQRENRSFEKDGKIEKYVSIVLNCRTLEKPRSTFVARPAYGVDVPFDVVADSVVLMDVNDVRTEKNITTVRFTAAVLES